MSLLYRMFRFYARGKTAKFFTLFLAGLAVGGADVVYWMQHAAAARRVPHQHHRRRGRARPARSLAEDTRPRGKCVGTSRKSCRGEPADACGSLNLPGRIWNPPLRCRGRCLHRPGGLTATARLLRANHVRPCRSLSAKYTPTLETYPILKTNAGEGGFYRMLRRCPLYKYKKTEAAGP